MATFVIVHGAWGGGWEWTPVARILRERGHDVFTPTLTGLGDRAHLGTEDTSLDDHIEDVLAVLTFEELDDVVLCGHSYGGMVVTGVADRVPERIQLLVYLDAFVPQDGQALIDLLPGEFAEAVVPGGRDARGGVPIPDELLPPEGVIDESVRARYIARVRPQPAATLTRPIRLEHAANGLRRAFVRCTGDPDPVVEPFVRRARDEGWPYREVPTAHDLQLLAPQQTAAVLNELASTVDALTPGETLSSSS